MPVRPFLSVGSVLGSHAAIVVSGVLLTLLIRRHQDDPAAVVKEALAYAAALAAAALLLHTLNGVHPAFWYHKNRATLPWCLLSSAWTAAWRGLRCTGSSTSGASAAGRGS